MTRPIVLPVFVFLFAGMVCRAVDDKTETISARIVAYDMIGNLYCLNDNAYWSAVAVTRAENATEPEFIVIKFSTRCTEKPKWFKGKARFRRFKLIRDKEFDEPLAESLVCKSVVDEKPFTCLPNRWKFLSGAEAEMLPFGKTPPAYRSTELPWAPVI